MRDRVQRVLALLRERASSARKRFLARWRVTAFSLSLVVGFLVLVSILAMQVTSAPRFCGACHFMEPYYQSWKTSTHSTVGCVECHIPPGITSEFRKKYEALSMVVSYFTGTYGTNPWTEIDDAACLRCHERRLLAGREVFRSVLFNHTPHLTEMRRRKKLRCTSCHSQIVQGSHIAVTESSCFLCHFKDQRLGEGTARCALCHEVPEKIITKANLSFNHAEVKRFNMQCSWCHSHVIQGTGDVPRERCYTCHNDPPRLQRYGETEYLHRMHITDHKIDCLNCHMEIQHKTARELEAAATSCSTCHRDGHSLQRDLYAGIGGKGVPPMPGAMYQAGIHCEGCHFLPPVATSTSLWREKAGMQVLRASEVSCMACHGPRYARILGRWRNLLNERLGQVKAEWTQARQLLGSRLDRGGTSGPDRGGIYDAWANIQLIERGDGTHNVDYSLRLIDASHDMINQALSRYGFKPLPKKWSSPPFESRCFKCHQGIEKQAGRFFGIAFSHRPHVESGLDCQTCHRPHEERSPKEVVRFGREGCAHCHHASGQRSSSYCVRCHSDVLAKKALYREKQFDHSMHVKDFGLNCIACHQAAGEIRRGPKLKVCSSCHASD